MTGFHLFLTCLAFAWFIHGPGVDYFSPPDWMILVWLVAFVSSLFLMGFAP